MRSLLAALVLVPLIAFAGWKSVGSRGTVVNDIVMVDAGQVLVSSSGVGGALSLIQLESDGGVTTVLEMPGLFVGGAVFGGCLAGQLTGAQLRYSDAGCGTNTTIGSSGRGLRGFGPNGLAFVEGAGSVLTLYVAPAGSVTPTSLGNFNTSATVLRTLHFGDADLIGLAALMGTWKLSIDGGLPAGTYGGGPFVDATMFERGGSPMLAATNAGSIVVFPDVRAPVLSTASFAGGVPRQIAAGADQAFVITTDGGLASAVPDPMNPLATWRMRRDIGVTWGTHLDCLHTRWCAANDSAANVWVYENANRPTVQAPIIVTDGGTVRVVLDAGDLDDDLLFHTWTVGSGVVVSPVIDAGLDDGVAVDLTFAPGCGPAPVSVDTTDGLYSVNTQVTAILVGRGAAQIEPPVMPPVAGGGPVTFSAYVDGGCDSATFTWASSSGQTQSGPTFDYQPPATSCGTSESITLTATWQSGAPAMSTVVVQTTPTPWGAPLVPTFPTPAMQLSGTPRVWSPVGPEHVCETTSGFPGIELEWAVDAGPGVMATSVDGGLLVDAAPLCLGTQLIATARAKVAMDALNRFSAPGTLVVDLAPNITRLDALANYALTAGTDAGVVVGDTTVIAACLPQRALKSEISVLDGVTVVASTRAAANEPFGLVVPGGCAGGTREVVARLYEDDLDTGAERRAQVTFDPTPTAVGELTPSRLTARCGQGVRGQLSLVPVPATCMAVETSWRQLDGTPLVSSAGVGVADVASTALDLSMVGQQLVFEWTVDGGAGNAATAQRTVDIGVDPFVAVSARTLPLLRREESAFEVEVVLTNETECAVDGLDVRIPMSAALPIAGTLLVDGARYDAVVDGDVLSLSGLSLPASGRAQLRFSAKPRLLGVPSVSAAVTLRGLPVSIDQAPATQPSGCGCVSMPGSALALLALFALGWRRRRE